MNRTLGLERECPDLCAELLPWSARLMIPYTYHICTIAIKVGATEASNEPRMKRAAISPPKPRAAVMPHRVAPQQKTITAQNLPIGNLTKK